MPQLSPNTVTVLDGDVRLVKRKNSRAWQAAFKIDGRWVRISTKCRQLDDARSKARELYLEYKMRQKNGLPVVSKRFADVARLVIADMEQQLEAGVGKKSWRDYKIVLEKYFIPYFGETFVTSIKYEELQKFSKWREEKIGHAPKASTLNTHNSALNRVFDEAVARGYINRTHVPVLFNKGRDSQRRPDFRREEYRKMINNLPAWIDAGRAGKSRDMRHLLRDYVLILANTGIRHGTETENLRWKHVHLFEEGGFTFLEMSVPGKTGQRDLVCRASTINYLKRIQSRCPDIADMTFEDLIRAQLDVPVFRLPDGTVSKNLRQTFKLLMKHTALLKCPRTGQDRTLYSLRHTYATFALLNDGMDVHTLAIQMGTSIGMIERHYSHLTPRLRKEVLTGKRYELSPEEYRRSQGIKGMALETSQLNAAVEADDDADEQLPNDPEADVGSFETDGVDSGAEVEVIEPDASTSAQQTAVPVETAAERAFDLFDAGKIGEAGLMAALGVLHADYVHTGAIAHRALDAVEAGRLSEAALTHVLRHNST
ncbi:MAG: site-specific integrase [Rhodobacteraceae bacterium]|nr:site-specific integrase [Paracoccaceae bacterium]